MWQQKHTSAARQLSQSAQYCCIVAAIVGNGGGGSDVAAAGALDGVCVKANSVGEFKLEAKGKHLPAMRTLIGCQ